MGKKAGKSEANKLGLPLRLAIACTGGNTSTHVAKALAYVLRIEGLGKKLRVQKHGIALMFSSEPEIRKMMRNSDIIINFSGWGYGGMTKANIDLVSVIKGLTRKELDEAHSRADWHLPKFERAYLRRATKEEKRFSNLCQSSLWRAMEIKKYLEKNGHI